MILQLKLTGAIHQSLKCKKMLRSRKLTNRDDIRFVFYEKSNLCADIQKLLDQNSAEKVQSHMNKMDRLRFVECFIDPIIKEAYLRTQDHVMTRIQLDARNSPVQPIDFYKLISDKFSKESFVLIIPAMPELHKDYLEETILDYSGEKKQAIHFLCAFYTIY